MRNFSSLSIWRIKFLYREKAIWSFSTSFQSKLALQLLINNLITVWQTTNNLVSRTENDVLFIILPSTAPRIQTPHSVSRIQQSQKIWRTEWWTHLKQYCQTFSRYWHSWLHLLKMETRARKPTRRATGRRTRTRGSSSSSSAFSLRG